MDRNAIIQAFINDLNYVDGLNLPLEMPARRVHYLAMALREKGLPLAGSIYTHAQLMQALKGVGAC